MFNIRKIQEKVLYDAVAAKSDGNTAQEIVYGDGETAAYIDNQHWVESSMDRLEKNFDKHTVKCIRMQCQCGYGMEEKLALLKDLMVNATCMEDLTLSEKAKSAGLFCKDGELYLQFWSCPCPMLIGVERLKSKTWCQCTTGYSKVLFEKAFACEVDVELLKSIKTGDDICLMKIIPHENFWNKR